MVASLLRLRLLSLANRTVRPRSAAERSAVVIAILVVVLAVAGLVLFARVEAAATPELRQDGFIVAGSIVVLAFWLMPFVFRVDDALDPRAFTPFALDRRRLAAGLAAAAFASVPTVLLVGLVAVFIAVWAGEGPGPLLSAILSGLFLVVSCVLASLVAGGVARGGITARNLGGLGLIIAAAVAAPLAAVLAFLDWPALGTTYLRRVASVLEWTPWGAPWGAPGEAATGNALGAIACVLTAVVLSVAFWFAWELIVRRAVSTPSRVAVPRRRHGLGVFDAMPATQTGVIAARSVTYWLRDPRYLVPILMLPIVPISIVVAFWLAGISPAVFVWIPVPVLALLLGWGVHNDIAADGTAFYAHVVASARGRADRWGRLVAPLVIGVPVAVLGSWVSGLLYGDDSVFLPLLSLSLCALLVALGVGSAASALLPYPTVAPGDGPFAQPQGTTGTEAGKQVASVGLAVLLCVPVVVLLVAGLLGDQALLPWAIGLGFALGPVVLVAGVETGAAVVDRRAPELLAFTQQN